MTRVASLSTWQVRVAPSPADRTGLSVDYAARHTFGAVHPFEGTTEALDAAVNATAAHFRSTLA